MKWFKRIGLLLVAIVLVTILAVVAFVLTFDPNDYKSQIAAQVEKQTGRSIQFNGDISVTIFPWLGAAAEDVVLANAEGFKPEAMVAVRRLEARAALLPLLRKQFEVGTLYLEGAQINLARHEDGSTNWDDLIAHQARLAAAPQAERPIEPQDGEDGDGLTMNLTVGGVVIRDGVLNWRDAQADQDLAINGLNLTTGELADGEPTDVKLVSGFRLIRPGIPAVAGNVDLSTKAQFWLERRDLVLTNLAFDAVINREGEASSALPEQMVAKLQADKADLRLASSQARLDGLTLDLSGKTVGPLSQLESRLETALEADWSTGRYELSSIKLTADLEGLPEVDGVVSVSASGAAVADLEAGTATVRNLEVVSDPVRASSDQIGLSGLDSGQYVASGPLTIAAFDPQALADRLGISLPAMRSDDALRQFAMSGQLELTPTRAMFDELEITLDGHRLSGRAGIDDLDSGRLFARLDGGELDLDPYLPPKSAGEKKKAAAAAADGAKPSATGPAEIELPTEALRGLDLDARLALASLRYEDYLLRKPVMHVTAAGGRLQLAELSGNAFDGQLDVSGALDVRGEVPSYIGKGRFRGISLQPFLMAVMDEERLLGKGDVTFDLATQGKRVDQIKSGLDGTANIALHDGKIKGFDIGYLLRRAQARLEGRTEPEPKEKSTDFTSITASATIRNGVVHNDDLSGASPLLRVTGEGQVDLPRDTIDYRLTATVVNTATGQEGKQLEALKQLPVPIRLKGPLNDPSITLDLESIVRDAAKGKAKERLEEELDKRLKDSAPLKELLKGFGR